MERKILKREEVQPSSFLKFLYNTRLGGLFLKLFSSPFISKLGGWFLNTKLSCKGINGFIKENGVDMSQYVEKKYSSFNDFFIREIKKELRPFDMDSSSLVCPCDGKLSVYEIDEECKFTVKGFEYTVATLLRNEALAREFLGGTALVFRLGADDYHHYFYFDDCRVEETKHIKGKFHTVQPVALKKRRVFCENTREYALLTTEHFKTAIQMEVGAMNVGKIVNYSYEGEHKKAEEKGRFEFGGSTIIVLLQKGSAAVDKDLLATTRSGDETIVRCGEKIGVRA